MSVSYQPHLLEICVKFCTRYLHVYRSRLREFCANRRREGRAFLTGINKLTFTPLP
jgi:hypothetical protein